MKLRMDSVFDDPSMGSCAYKVSVETEVPPEAGPWDQHAVESVFETWIDKIVGGDFEDVHFMFFADGKQVKE